MGFHCAKEHFIEDGRNYGEDGAMSSNACIVVGGKDEFNVHAFGVVVHLMESGGKLRGIGAVAAAAV